MSCSYLGPYARVVLKKEPRTYEEESCPNTGCQSHGRFLCDMFCPSCGSHVAKVKVTEMVTYSFSMVVSEDQLTPLGHQDENLVLYLGPNTHGDDRPRPREVLYLGGNDDEHLDLAGIDVAAETRWFESAYADALQKLRDKYGETNVSVSWGAHFFTWR